MTNSAKQEILNSLQKYEFTLKIADNESTSFNTLEEAGDYLDNLNLTERELSDLYFANTGNFIEDLENNK